MFTFRGFQVNIIFKEGLTFGRNFAILIQKQFILEKNVIGIA